MAERCSSISHESLRRLQALAEAQGQSVDGWIDDMARLAERRARPRPAGPTGASACPLVGLVHDYFLTLCKGGPELAQLGSALRAAAVDGEGSRLGPLRCDGTMIALDPQHDGVRVVGGGGRFTLTNAAALQLADRLCTHSWRPTLVA